MKPLAWLYLLSPPSFQWFAPLMKGPLSLWPFSRQCAAMKKETDVNLLLFPPQGRTAALQYPVYCQVFIALLLVSTVSCIPLAALYAFCKKRRQDKKEERHSFSTESA